MFTPFGKTIRKMRIDKEVRLKNMADYIGVKSAFLSAIETGKKNITQEIFDKTVEYFNLNEAEIESLKKDARDSIMSVKIPLVDKSDQTRELVTAFARNLGDLEPTDIEKIKRILNNKG